MDDQVGRSGDILLGRDSNGEVVATQAARIYDWPGSESGPGMAAAQSLQASRSLRTHPDGSRSEPGRPVGLQIDPACLLQFDSAGMRLRQAEQIEVAA
jgi:hypothetical protein